MSSRCSSHKASSRSWTATATRSWASASRSREAKTASWAASRSARTRPAAVLGRQQPLAGCRRVLRPAEFVGRGGGGRLVVVQPPLGVGDAGAVPQGAGGFQVVPGEAIRFSYAASRARRSAAAAPAPSRPAPQVGGPGLGVVQGHRNLPLAGHGRVQVLLGADLVRLGRPQPPVGVVQVPAVADDVGVVVDDRPPLDDDRRRRRGRLADADADRDVVRPRPAAKSPAAPTAAMAATRTIEMRLEMRLDWPFMILLPVDGPIGWVDTTHLGRCLYLS